MRYSSGVRRTAAALVAAAAVTALAGGCTPSGSDPAVGKPSASSTPTAPTAPTASSSPVGSTSGGAGAPSAGHSSPTPAGGTKPCTADQVKVSDGHQADVRPSGTGTGAALVSVTNSSTHPCTLRGFPTVAGAGNGSPEHNSPLATTSTGSPATVSLAPGARAWTKLTFVNVQGEADGYCVSGAKPVTFPTLVIGVPGAGAHQIAMDDGVFAECDNKVTVTAFSSTKPS
ncbi:DUF4232 domain-containing protein [Streptomyces sp. NPDC059917]|uniref:DUF4232 domain-containing protein n=1 Tax=Streptomyces sp. NPDC059917 TaxID=3347002 RepID=UPI003650354F